MEPSTSLHDFYQSVRRQTLHLTENLSAEDMVGQSMPEASPSKWHLAHTTWFFETFILREHCEDYRAFDDQFSYLFNSYYESAGERHPRPNRGLLTRPDLATVLAYRAHVDEQMEKAIEAQGELLYELVVTGLHHEMQHQELLLTDILHLLSFNPLAPALHPPRESHRQSPGTLRWQNSEGGLVEIGAYDRGFQSGDFQDGGFSYDCERPRHKFYLQAFKMARRVVTNGEWLDFMADGGYSNPMLWLADGWDACQRHQWQAPLYWRLQGGEWRQFGLDGLQPLNPAAPVCHVSYYEADAYARWAGKRLPSEQEWEHCAETRIRSGTSSQGGNFLESAQWRPQVSDGGEGIAQLYGDVWEWTRSPYMAYPGFEPAAGALQEYNGKFMANQFVLRGGSCVTPRRQMRPSYRNFFFPEHRWQFTGLRLAEDN